MNLAVLMALFVSSDLEENLSLIQRGRADEAISSLRKVLESAPENGRAHELLALAYLRQNKLEIAETEAAKALELNTGSTSAHITAARIAIARQNFAAATRELSKATELDSSNADILLYRGSLYLARKDHKTAVAVLTPYVTANPEEPYGHYYLGLAQYGMKRPDKTVEHFQRFLSLSPDAPEAARVESLLRSIR
jgi:tetratricopeptide (TPR) repeat protein